MSLKRKLSTIVIATTAFGLASCFPSLYVSPKEYPSGYITGEVLREYGNVAQLVEPSRGLITKETVKLGDPNYVIEVNTLEGTYVIQVDAGDACGSKGPHTIYNLAAAIEEGTRIKFPTKVKGRCAGRNPAGFSSDKIGLLDPDDIEVLE